MTERKEVPQTALEGELTTPQPTSPQIDEARDLVRETIAETNLKQRAAKLLDELFAANFTYQQGKYISPLNAESAGQALGRAERAEKQKEKELFTSLSEVKEAIERDGGISEETYERHKYAINSIARDLVGQRWWGSGLSHLCEQEDREGKEATAEQIARFPEDTDFTEGQHGHTNIFDQGHETSDWEGTLFHPQYEDLTFSDTGVKVQGHMESLRIFHQGHRNALSIRTVNVSDLMAKIELFVAEFTEEVPGQQFGFTLDREAYLRKMTEFNEQFGNLVTLEIIDDNVVAKFNANPQQVAEKLVELGHENGLELIARMGTNTYMVVPKQDDKYGYPYTVADFLLLDNLQGRHDRFDPEKHKNTPAVLLPYLQPKFANDLIGMYATQEEKE